MALLSFTFAGALGIYQIEVFFDTFAIAFFDLFFPFIFFFFCAGFNSAIDESPLLQYSLPFPFLFLSLFSLPFIFFAATSRVYLMLRHLNRQ